MNRIFSILIVFFILCTAPVYAQNIDHLENQLLQDIQDTTRVQINNELFLAYEFSDTTKAKYHLKAAKELAEEINFLEGLAVAWMHQGFYYDDIGKFSEAIDAFQKAITYYEKVSESDLIQKQWYGKTGVANSLINMGNAHNGVANYPAALTCYQDAQKIYEKYLDSENDFEVQVAQKKIANCIYNTGNIHFYQDNLDRAIECYNKSNNFYEKVADSNGISGTYLNLGVVYFQQKKIDEALDLLMKSLDICLKTNDIQNMSNCYLNLGNIYHQTGELDKALDAEQKAYEIHERIGNKSGMSAALGNISTIHLKLGELQKGIETAQKSLDFAIETGALEWQRTAYLNLSLANDSLGNHEDAIKYYKQSVLIKDSIYNLDKYQQLAEMEAIYQLAKKQKEIELHQARLLKQEAEAALDNEKKQKEIEMQDVELAKQKNEIKQKDFQRNAFIAGFLLILLLAVFILRSYLLKRKANLVLIEKNNEINQQKEEINTQAEELLQKNEMLAAKNKEIQAHADELKEINQQLEQLSIIARETDNAVTIANPNGDITWINEGFTRLFGYTLSELVQEKGKNIAEASSSPYISDKIQECTEKGKSVSYVARNITKDKRKLWVQTTITPIIKNDTTEFLVAIDSDITRIKFAEEKLGRTNQLMTDSINYARLIQQAILPDVSAIKEVLPDTFIQYMPRDIVSGDFYWFFRKDINVWFVSADCTGHGVPGALMSMIGNTLLNEAVRGKMIESPSQILHHLNSAVIEILNQQVNVTQDEGMEMSIVRYNLKSKEITVASANQEALLFHNGQCITVKTGDYPVGGLLSARRTANYSEVSYQLNEGDVLYMFSDGVTDQFGGKENKKFSLSKLKNILSDISTEPIEIQEEIIKKEINHWMNPEAGIKYAQTDDILFAGIKF